MKAVAVSDHWMNHLRLGSTTLGLEIAELVCSVDVDTSTSLLGSLSLTQSTQLRQSIGSAHHAAPRKRDCGRVEIGHNLSPAVKSMHRAETLKRRCLW